MTNSSEICLPTLDGTVESTVARLDAWLHRYDGDTVDDAVYTVRACLQEAQAVLSGFSAAEECDNEVCTKSGDIEYLSEELGKALQGLRDLELAAFDLKVVAS